MYRVSGRVVPVYLRPTCSPFRWKGTELDTSDQMEFFHFIFPPGPARDIKFHWLRRRRLFRLAVSRAVFHTDVRP